MSLAKIKENKIIYKIYYNTCIFWPRMMALEISTFFNLGNKKRNYKKIKQYKDKYSGQRCFIVATGPSLKMEDLELIKGEKSFGVNSIVLAYDKTDWRPTFYGLQDRAAYVRLEKEILESREQVEEFFCGVSKKQLTPDVKCDCCYYRLNLLNHDDRGIKRINKCSKKVDRYVYDGHSITYSMIEIAMYMGFKEIVLLGVDCDYSSKKAHFIEYTEERDVNPSIKMYNSFCEMKKYADREGIRILNASRGGKLDVFECVQLEDLI